MRSIDVRIEWTSGQDLSVFGIDYALIKTFGALHSFIVTALPQQEAVEKYGYVQQLRTDVYKHLNESKIKDAWELRNEVMDIFDKYECACEKESVEPLCNIPSQIEINKEWIRDNPTTNIAMAHQKINEIIAYLASNRKGDGK